MNSTDAIRQLEAINNLVLVKIMQYSENGSTELNKYTSKLEEVAKLIETDSSVEKSQKNYTIEDLINDPNYQSEIIYEDGE